MYKLYLDPVGVAHAPDNYEDRLAEIFPKTFKHLRLCAVDTYDLAFAKLERNTQRDRDDVKHLARTVPLRSGSAERALSEGVALAAWQPGARGPYSTSLDRDDEADRKNGKT
jgi:hypothetical protein